MGLYYVSLCRCFCVITKITIFRTSAGQLLAGWNASSRPNVCKVVFLGCRYVLPLHPFSFPWYLLTLSLLLHSSTLFLPWPPLPSTTCGLSSWFLTPYLLPPHGSSFSNPLPTPCASSIYVPLLSMTDLVLVWSFFCCPFHWVSFHDFIVLWPSLASRFLYFLRVFHKVFV